MNDLQPVALDGFPEPLEWTETPVRWAVDPGPELTITAGPRCDMFVDPGQTAVFRNAPRLLFNPQGDFMLEAQVTVEFAATYDAGVLLLYAGETLWAKLCFEYSPQAEPMVVSVVTREYSDDANSVIVDGHTVWLRVSRLDPAFAFHWSSDGQSWHFVRHFSLPGAGPISAGFMAQSPTGEGCTAHFKHIAFRPERLSDLRGGM